MNTLNTIEAISKRMLDLEAENAALKARQDVDSEVINRLCKARDEMLNSSNSLKDCLLKMHLALKAHQSLLSESNDLLRAYIMTPAVRRLISTETVSELEKRSREVPDQDVFTLALNNEVSSVYRMLDLGLTWELQQSVYLDQSMHQTILKASHLAPKVVPPTGAKAPVVDPVVAPAPEKEKEKENDNRLPAGRTVIEQSKDGILYGYSTGKVENYTKTGN
jgi:hypothetical protein